MKVFFASKSRVFPLLLLVVAVAIVVTTVALSAWLDSGWTEATAAAGLGATVLAAAVLLGTAQGWTNGTRLSLAAASTAVVGLGAVALVVVTYVGGVGDAGMPGESNVSQDVVNDANVAQGDDIGSILAEQISNNEIQPPGYSHDVGAHLNFENFVSSDEATVLRNVPGGTVLPDEVGVLQDQLRAARGFAETVDTVEKAEAAGYRNTTNDVPFMGAHFLNGEYVRDGIFDPAKPEGLLFSKLGGGPDAEWQLVGVWYLLFPGINEGVTESIPPEGFAGNLELWHQHHGLCTRAGIISEDNTAEGCAADNGNFIGDLRWMIHVWLWPENADNPDGVFAYLNADLWRQQQNVRAAP
ncbi:MAG: hypothetical protein U1B78_00830 [Dehalococcoidia bacterium]|nr:hypothetical protein [Dehalococcoidia bacterium]MDZ4277662.1 hypothetical protein [Dehalococcoidia bacterium]